MVFHGVATSFIEWLGQRLLDETDDQELVLTLLS